MEILVIVFYAAILALVAPFVLKQTDHYGKLVPAGIAAVSGGALWFILTWAGLHYDEAWIWFIVMLGMPIATFFGSNFLAKKREHEEEEELAAIRLRGKA